MSLDTTASISGRFSEVAAPATMMPQAALTQQVVPQPQSLLDAFSFQGRPDDSKPDAARELQNRLQAATTNTSAVWKPTSNALRPDSVIKGAEGLAQSHGARKGAAATTMQTNQVAEIKNILQEMSAAGGEPARQGAAGGMAGKIATDALLTTGMTMALGPVGGIVATGIMAAKAGLSGLEGQGTLVTFNQQSPGYFGSTSSKGSRAKDSAPIDYGYMSSPTPGQQAGNAPASNAFQKAMNQGPGFGGRTDILADSKMPGQTFDQIAIKIAADSPAGKAMEGMRLNSRQTSESLLAQRDGIDLNEKTLGDAMDIGIKMPQQGMKIPTFKMA